MKDFSKLSQLMREDWNRRVLHDYRFWMTEAHVDDTAMWKSGERDSSILLEGIPDCDKKVFLEIGCGIGRILRAALKKFNRVIGFDVAEAAISKARELLGHPQNLELYAGNGYSLDPVKDSSVDVVASFAAITSMPVDVAANYLREMHRILKPGGLVRLQLYLGEEQIVARNDTLHLRCFRKENFLKAAELASFEVVSVNELVLPVQVSFKEMGFEAVIVSLCKLDGIPDTAENISAQLLPGGEENCIDEGKDREIECWMSLNYAKDLVERDEIEKAEAALEYALTFTKTATIDVRDLLQKVMSELDKKRAIKANKTIELGKIAPANAELYERNMRAISEYFPELASRIGEEASDSQKIETKSTADGLVIFFDRMCLDHPDKPVAAADNWTKRAKEEGRVKQAEHVAVFGFGSGYHIEALLSQFEGKVSVIEPSAAVFRAAMSSRDLTTLISRLKHLSIGNSSSWQWLDGDCEIVMRPQTQALYPEMADQLKSSFFGKRGLSTLRPSIAVLGPMQGGTLPIMNYCGRGLLSIGQRTRLLDMSNFAAGFHGLDKFVFDKMRRSSIEGTYIEMMSQVTLEAFNEKPADILICMAQAPMTGRVLTELRRRGVITVLWFVEDYLRFTYWKEIAQYYDFVFTIQKGECVSAISKAGAGHVQYVPVGCDPIVHTPMSLSPEEKERWGSPISFVGAGYHNRQQMLASLCEMPFKIWGTEWPECKPFDRMVQEQGRRLAPEEYIKIFNSTEINLNLHSSAERDGVDPTGDFVNPRTFELASSGAFQLLEPGKEVITFNNLPQLKEQIAYYLAHPEERYAVTQAARKRVLHEHTYAHRLQEMLSIIFAKRYEQLKERSDRNPWKKMIERAAPHEELLSRCEHAFQRGEEPILDALISDIVSGKGKLSDTEKKLLFLFHVRKQIIRMKTEEGA